MQFLRYFNNFEDTIQMYRFWEISYVGADVINIVKPCFSWAWQYQFDLWPFFLYVFRARVPGKTHVNVVQYLLAVNEVIWEGWSPNIWFFKKCCLIISYMHIRFLIKSTPHSSPSIQAQFLKYMHICHVHHLVIFHFWNTYRFGTSKSGGVEYGFRLTG